MRQQDGGEEKIITDSSFAIVSLDGTRKRYHLECQSSADGSMLIRMYEYDSQIALQDGKFENDTLVVNFPESAILYLRYTKNTPDKLAVKINTPGGILSYYIPTLKVKQYSIDEIFERGLYFIIPFHIFSYESSFNEIDKDMIRLNLLQQEYTGIVDRLNKLVENGVLNEFTKSTICEMSNKVLQKIATNHVNIMKEVSDVMGGKVLEYEAKTILNEGCQNEQIRIIKNMLSQLKTKEEIADLLALPLEEVEQLIKLATN